MDKVSDKEERIKEMYLLSKSETDVEKFVENPGIIKNYMEKYLPSLISFLIQVVVAIIFLLVGIKIIKCTIKLIKKAFDRSNMDASVSGFLLALIKYVLYFILIMAILSGFGVATGSVVALLGSAGLTIGLALQGSLSNFAGGVLILILKPFVLEDYIIVDGLGVDGTVKEISLFYTKLNTVDNKAVMIPNGKLADSCITNVSMMNKRRVDVFASVAYDSDIKKVKSVLTDLAMKEEALLSDQPVDVFVSELKDSCIEIGVRIWVPSDMYWKTKWHLTEELKYALDENNISIPFPQLDVKIK